MWWPVKFDKADRTRGTNSGYEGGGVEEEGQVVQVEEQTISKA